MAQTTGIDLMALYKRDLDPYLALSKETELELAVKARAGSLAAREALVKANLRLVVSVASRYADRADILDLIQAGNLGLLRAVENFDPTRGAKFSTYAVWPIRQAIREEVRRQIQPLRVPESAHKRLRRQARMREKLTQAFGREPNARELAAVIGGQLQAVPTCYAEIPVACPPKRLEKIESQVQELEKVSTYRLVSLEAPLSPGDSNCLSDLIEDKVSPTPLDQISQQMLRETLDRAFSTLSERERQILEMRYGLHDGEVWEFKEIAQHFNLTCPQVRHILGNAIAKLQNEGTFSLLEGYLD